MAVLERDDLEFARRHLTRFEDTDFFPKFSEYDAVWADWDSVVERLTTTNVRNLPLAPATSMPVAKGLSTYRIVHQLEPLTSLVYTALAHRVGSPVERARSPLGERRACSNRFAPDDGAFFSGGNGYEEFRERSQELVEKRSFVATADISDFFNQIYSHRVRAAIESADHQLGDVAHDVEIVIHACNSAASKGIPVGPEPSRLFAEGVMIDVDQLISRHGLEHTRYVDDIRIFSDDEQDLHSIVETLSDYLYSNHRLNLNGRKTGVFSDLAFIERIAPDHRDDETNAAMARLRLLDPYGDSIVAEEEPEEDDILDEIAGVVEERFERDGYVDQNLLKAFLRRSANSGSLHFLRIARQHPSVFVSVFHELAKAMEQALSDEGADLVRGAIEVIRAEPMYRRRAVRYWMDWVCAGDGELLRRDDVMASVFGGSIRAQARAATSIRDLAWLRARRDNFVFLPPTDRISVMGAMRILGQDERRAIVNQIDDNRATPIDLAMKKWLRMQ